MGGSWSALTGSSGGSLKGTMALGDGASAEQAADCEAILVESEAPLLLVSVAGALRLS